MNGGLDKDVEFALVIFWMMAFALAFSSCS